MTYRNLASISPKDSYMNTSWKSLCRNPVPPLPNALMSILKHHLPEALPGRRIRLFGREELLSDGTDPKLRCNLLYVVLPPARVVASAGAARSIVVAAAAVASAARSSSAIAAMS